MQSRRWATGRCASRVLHSAHYVESVFENWESEFLWMGIYVSHPGR
jgi:hypothetical protein